MSAVETGDAGGHLDAAQDVREQQRLLPVDAFVPQRGVEGATPVIPVAPGDGMVAHARCSARHAVTTRVIGALVYREEHVDVVPRVRPEVVPLLLAGPGAPQLLG